jgi:hypothetical protein
MIPDQIRNSEFGIRNLFEPYLNSTLHIPPSAFPKGVALD